MSLTIREEKILEAAVAGEQSPIEPVTRREAIFAKATGADVELPPARNKEEDILSKLAVGYAEGGGGGGGGGDFSTAEVTVKNSTGDSISVFISNIDGNGVLQSWFSINDSEVKIIKTPYSENGAYHQIGLNECNVSGNVQFIEEEGAILITGNGTLEILSME